MTPTPHLRIARPTADLPRAVAMYRDGLGLVELGGFADHDGFDGAMLGAHGAGWHLELTCERDRAPLPPDPDQLLVLYLPDAAEWRTACARMLEAGFAEVASHNPYWDRDGSTFADADGHRVVLQRAAWAPAPAT